MPCSKPSIPSMFYTGETASNEEIQMLYKGNVLQHSSNAVKQTRKQQYAAAVSKRTHNLGCYTLVGGTKIFLATGLPAGDLPLTTYFATTPYDQQVILSGGVYVPKATTNATKCFPTGASGVGGPNTLLCWNRSLVNWNAKRQTQMTAANGARLN
jgi:hypothetical protein